MPEPIAGNRYLPGLDGLRALAVLAVIAYHLQLPFAPGGLLGVGVFFVLSGYLITDGLLGQWDRTGTISLPDFWKRRARRLLPALGTVLAAVLAWVTLLRPAQLPALRADTLAAVLYISNWWAIFHHVSYFAKFGPPSPLSHLWSLAVEEQFYLIWPILLILGLRHVPRRGRLAGLILLGALASAGLMAWIYVPGTDPSRVYYGTDTRAFALLIGAALAVVWPSRRLAPLIGLRSRRILDGTGLVSLGILLAMIIWTNQYALWLYRGGLLAMALASAVLVAVLAHPASRLAQVMGSKPLRWLGVRSYGIYLWHYPIIVLTTSSGDWGRLNLFRALAQVGASVGLAALSWRYLEEPIRHGAAERLWLRLRAGARWRDLSTRTRIVAATILGPFIIAGMGVVGGSVLASSWNVGHVLPPAPSPTPISPSFISMPSFSKASPSPLRTSVATTSADTPSHSPVSPQSSPSPITRPSPSPSPSPSSNPSSSIQPAVSKGSQPATVSPTAKIGAGVTAIGDSVLIDAAPYLTRLLPGIQINGHIGRQLTQAMPIVKQLKSQGKLGHAVIIELGTNGPFTQSELQNLLKALGSVQQIVLVNTRVPRPWQNPVNSLLAKTAASFPHTTLVHWHAASQGHPDFFYPDGVHLTPKGSAVYAQLLAHAVSTGPTPANR